MMSELVMLFVQIAPAILTLLLGYLVANAAAGYLAWKDALSQLAEVTSALNDVTNYLCVALADDAVTEEEFRELFDKAVVLVDESRKLTANVLGTGLGSMISGLFTGLFRTEYRAAVLSRVPFRRRG